MAGDGSRRGWALVAFAAAGFCVLAAMATGATRRNVGYLALFHGRDAASLTPPAGTGHADSLLSLRIGLARADWPTAGTLFAATAGPDRLALLLVVREAEARLNRHDIEGARAALRVVRDGSRVDATGWVILGETFEKAALPADAAQAYRRAVALESSTLVSARSALVLLAYRQQHWQDVLDAAAPILASLKEADLTAPVRRDRAGGARWQGVVYMAADAAEHLGRDDEAERLYLRLCADPRAPHDWVLNRALVALARIEGNHGAVEQPVARLSLALDMSAGFPDSFRGEYEAATAAAARDFVARAQRRGDLAAVRRVADARAQSPAAGAGARFIAGVAADLDCDPQSAARAYEAARQSIPRGAGTYLDPAARQPYLDACRR
jgi:hypothetical protein